MIFISGGNFIPFFPDTRILITTSQKTNTKTKHFTDRSIILFFKSSKRF